MCIGCATVRAEPHIVVQDQPYEVRGTTLKAVWLDIKRQASSAGGVHPGYTNRSVTWSYNIQTVGDRCATTQLQVTAIIERHLPQWQDPPRPETDAGKEWARFIKALSAHEDGHVKIGRQIAKQVEAAMLQAASRTPDCRRLKGALEAAAQKAMSQGKRLDAEYDQVTRHGKTQGTILTIKG